jgi:hypothetical protein
MYDPERSFRDHYRKRLHVGKLSLSYGLPPENWSS